MPLNIISRRALQNYIRSPLLRGKNTVIAGLDVGSKKTGIALSDTHFMRAKAFKTIKMQPLDEFEETAKELMTLINKNRVAALVW